MPLSKTGPWSYLDLGQTHRKYSMDPMRVILKLAGLTGLLVLILSCQHLGPVEDPLKKVNSDLFPNKITRAEYHFEIARG